MQHLTETLLWLSREDGGKINSVPVSLDTMVKGLLEDNAYLLQGKEIEVVFEEKGVIINAAETPCRIAISNLIRNAFQHTEVGVVTVELMSDTFKIRNDGDPDRDTENESQRGYGFGLLLVQKIVSRMGWRMEYQNIPGGRETTLSFQ